MTEITEEMLVKVEKIAYAQRWAADRNAILEAVAAARELAGLKARLPKTADGVGVIPDVPLELWCPRNLSEPANGYELVKGRIRQYVGGDYCITADDRNQCWEVGKCFSTAEAATLHASRGKGETNG